MSLVPPAKPGGASPGFANSTRWGLTQGHIGEDPRGIPSSLFPFVSQVVVGRRHRLQLFGGDFSTPDGSCVCDYIHVMDLAEGHRVALDTLLSEEPQLLTLNLGSGQGHSTLVMCRDGWALQSANLNGFQPNV